MVANLGVAIAQTGKRVIIIDGDMRRPSMHTWFGIVNRESGLSNLLSSQSVNIEEVTRPTNVYGIDLVSSGPIPPNPAELLGSTRMKSILSESFEPGPLA